MIAVSVHMCSVFTLARLISSVVYVSTNMVVVKLLAHGLLGLCLYFYVQLPCTLTTLAVFGVYLATGGWKFAKVVLQTIPRDIR